MQENPFLLAPNQRLAEWVALRHDIRSMKTDEAMRSVVNFWAMAPIQPKTRPCDPTAWPSVWSMLHHGDWCRNSLAAGIEATFRLAGWDSSRLEICTIEDENRGPISVVVIDGSHTLNYVWGTVVETPEPTSHIVAKWVWGGRAYAPTA